ncbi:transcriptional regulator BetI [Pelagimonas varians]|uniref:HTH-type transcriptional regulator BetI n=1 Tax=Pelagimonas varians TaxID=696760 RepID=A0A238KXC2_9RHOB|nr:transcriptional regulator BetI [Pelagimonas varians]PYG27763.1 TetR family transcriptional regulator [Pelagimonas varians]SMX47429.1 HTH-type transcriptional regulator BetI [Pelagimonas varians]
MPKIGQEPKRRAALVAATVEEIGAAGSLDVTVGQIAKRAGMSSALAHHYFGGKAQIFLAAMRHIMTEYSRDVRAALDGAAPGKRLEAIIDGSFDPNCFDPAAISAWLNFYVLAQRDAEAARLLNIYQRRLNSNLTHALRGRCADPETVAVIVAAQIDGVYLRSALDKRDMASAAAQVRAVAHALTGEGAV